MKRNFKGLIKLAQGFDPTENFATYNPSPTAPAAFTSTDRYATPTPDQVEEAMKNVDTNDVLDLYRAAAAVPLSIAAGPHIAARVGSTARSIIPGIRRGVPLASHVASGLGKEVLKTIWQGGGNLIADEQPLVRGLGYLYRTVSNLGPIALWLKHKYNLGAEKLGRLAQETTRKLHSFVDSSKSALRNTGEQGVPKQRGIPVPKLPTMVPLTDEEIDDLE